MNAVRSQDKFDAGQFKDTANDTEGVCLNDFQPRRSSTMILESDEFQSSFGTSFTPVGTKNDEAVDSTANYLI